NGDSTNNLTFDMNSAGGVFSNNETFNFTVDPDTPPAEYASATLKGDYEKAVIDLDGSGNEDDDDDIVFEFDEPLKHGTGATPYEDSSGISFDIKGSTAWEEVTEDEIKSQGYYNFTADFLGGEEGSTEMDIQFDVGAEYDGVNWISESMATTQYAKASSTTFQSSDGYAAGDLQGVDVASDGVMTGIYSNGELIPLFRVGLAKFLSNQGLKTAGGNLFRETRDSGEAITNKPGENGLGTISPNSLEMSNVDISDEFVKMITTQRGFQANSKTITTVDDMMSTVIQMKR
ncbi:MAG: flagellar hook-basal body complex protein, partial [Desulfobacteraceae bacterium]